MNRAEPSLVHEWNTSGTTSERRSAYTWPSVSTETPKALPQTPEPNNEGESDIQNNEKSTQPNQES